MKKEYIKPEQRVVVLQYRAMLLDGSPLRTTNTNLKDNEEDDLDIDENTPATTGFWAR